MTTEPIKSCDVTVDGVTYPTVIVNGVRRFIATPNHIFLVACPGLIDYHTGMWSTDWSVISIMFQQGELSKGDYIRLHVLSGHSVDGLHEVVGLEDVKIEDEHAASSPSIYEVLEGNNKTRIKQRNEHQRQQVLAGGTHVPTVSFRWLRLDGHKILQQRCETYTGEVFWKDVSEASDAA